MPQQSQYPRKKRISTLGKILLISFLLISLIPLAFVSYISFEVGYKNLYHGTTNSLNASSKLELEYIKLYFKNKQQEIELISKLSSTIKMLTELKQLQQQLKISPKFFVISYEWRKYIIEKCRDLEHSLHLYGYLDLLLIDKQGNLLYTVMKNKDLGTNIYKGIYSNSKLSRACIKATKTGQVALSTREIYLPIKKHSIFLVKSIINKNGDNIGLIAINIPIKPINQVIIKNNK